MFGVPGAVGGDLVGGRLNAEIVRATTIDEAKPMLKLRHHVYCIRHGWLPENPDGMETDEHDAAAIHLGVMHRGEMAAACRVLFKPPLSAAAIVPKSLWALAHTIVNGNPVAELSRLTAHENAEPGHVEALCLAAIEEMRMGFARWCVALMAVSLIRHLDRHGVHAIRLAPPVNHYGQRYLCLIDLDAMEGAA